MQIAVIGPCGSWETQNYKSPTSSGLFCTSFRFITCQQEFHFVFLTCSLGKCKNGNSFLCAILTLPQSSCCLYSLPFNRYIVGLQK